MSVTISLKSESFNTGWMGPITESNRPGVCCILSVDDGSHSELDSEIGIHDLHPANSGLFSISKGLLIL
jgi:hypothetical protein